MSKTLSKTPRKAPEIPIEETEVEEKPQKDVVQIKFSKKILWIPFILLFAAALFYVKQVNDKKIEDQFKNKILPQAIAKIVKNPSMKVTVDNLKETNGVYQFDLNLGEGAQKQKYISYITKDGQVVFTSGIRLADLDKAQGATTQNAQGQAQTANVPKKSVPQVDLFVMSYCPFGLQIEKGILPVLETLKDKIQFNLKFVSYTMHGEKEIDENLKQYCIKKEEPAKLNDYLKCFAQSGNSEECNSTAGINSGVINSCIALTDSKFGVKAKFADKSTWNNGQFPPFDVDKEDNTKYNVQGSPTLVVNGTTVGAQRDPASLLTTICSAFSNKPKECEVTLSKTQPNAGFESTATQAGGAAASNTSCVN